MLPGVEPGSASPPAPAPRPPSVCRSRPRFPAALAGSSLACLPGLGLHSCWAPTGCRSQALCLRDHPNPPCILTQTTAGSLLKGCWNFTQELTSGARHWPPNLAPSPTPACPPQSCLSETPACPFRSPGRQQGCLQSLQPRSHTRRSPSPGPAGAGRRGPRCSQRRPGRTALPRALHPGAGALTAGLDLLRPGTRVKERAGRMVLWAGLSRRTKRTGVPGRVRAGFEKAVPDSAAAQAEEGWGQTDALNTRDTLHLAAPVSVFSK